MVEVDPAYGPGEWPISYASCADLSEYLTEQGSPDPATRLRYERMAASLLWEWTGRKFGPRTVTLRPYAQADNHATTWRGGAWWTWKPLLVNGQWYNVRCGVCNDVTCDCAVEFAITLPGPIASVDKVIVDGEVVPPEKYRVDNRRTLVRLDGRTWPRTQNLTADATDKTAKGGTFEITYKRGVPVPEGGQIAAGVLALELARAACSDRDCSLPQRVQSVTRQGVSIDIAGEFEDVQDGRTGIWLIDSWVASVSQPNRGGRVYSPDRRHRAPAGRTGIYERAVRTTYRHA
jgi:hypothetical protein